MKFTLRQVSVLTAALLIAVGGYAAIIRAQNQTTTSQSQFTISPVSYETTVDAGTEVSNKVTVFNNTDKSLNLTTEIENIRRTNNEGVVELTTETTPYDLASWVTFEPKEFTLSARGSQDISYTIKVPENASPGGHYGSLLFGTPPAKVDGSGAAIVQRIGSLVLIRVNGDVKEAATVSSFRTKTYVGTWEEVASSDGKTKTLVARDEDKTKERYQRYYSKGPIAFDTVISNQGNVHIKPAGYVTVYNVFNKKIAELPLNPQNVFPGSERNMTIIWPKQNLWGIFYKAQFVGLYGAENDKSLTNSTTFWAFPKEAAITIIVVLLLILLLRRRLSRAFAALFTGNVPKEAKPSTKPTSTPKEEKSEPEPKEKKK